MNVTGKRVNSTSLSSREKVVYTRLRLGHTDLNATLQIVGRGYGSCIECQDKEAVEHVIFACYIYNKLIAEQYGRQRKKRTQFVLYLKKRG